MEIWDVVDVGVICHFLFYNIEREMTNDIDIDQHTYHSTTLQQPTKYFTQNMTESEISEESI